MDMIKCPTCDGELVIVEEIVALNVRRINKDGTASKRIQKTDGIDRQAEYLKCLRCGSTHSYDVELDTGRIILD